ncbi:MAG: ComEC/Rec2 family competence protein [Fimbriimonadaceae bacterium]|nr:ComEC/Rec2 family competence protein [Fimbriimonadaceae bacterium]
MERAALTSRPLAIVLACYVAGLCCTWSWFSLLWIAAIVALIRDSRILVGLSLFAGLVGALLRPATPIDLFFEAKEAVIEGRIGAVPMPSDGGMRFRLDTDRGPVIVRSEATVPFSWGAQVRVQGRLRPSSEADPPGLATAGRMSVDTVEVIRDGPWPLPQVANMTRAFGDQLDRTMPEGAAALGRALLLNQTADLDDQTSRSLRASGTLHIVAASGAHVVLLGLLLAPLIQWLPIPRAGRVFLLILLLSVFAVAAGFRPPIVRAVVMAAILSLPPFVRRVPDAITTWAVTAGVPLLIWPTLLHDLGFQLSVVAVGALIFGVPQGIGTPTPWRSWGDLMESLRALVVASSVAYLGTLPLIAYHFGEVAIFGLLANLLVLPVLPVLMFSLPFAGIPVVSFFAIGLAGYVAGVTQWVAQLPGAVAQVPWFAAEWIGATWLSGFFAYRIRRREAER